MRELDIHFILPNYENESIIVSRLVTEISADEQYERTIFYAEIYKSLPKID